ncbi:MAG: MATE family efflux transporter [Thermoplasmata archaeon]|nr:MAG: MATE family efflux transporter [Thermoplasmata archaeon]
MTGGGGKGFGRPTEGVKTLLGNPRKAIIKLSIPMIIAMSVQTFYNLVDAIWVAGLPHGGDALAAIGLFFPFFFLIMALAAGLGIGGGAAISRRIGARDKRGADNVADHMVILVMITALLFTVPMFMAIPGILKSMGARDSLDMAVGYGRIIIGFSVIIFFNNIANAILRAEGDTKRAMYAMILGSGLNIILDPVFIYGFGLGVEGAAWATMASFTVTFTLLFYWLFFKKDTFVTFRFRDFRFRWNIIRDIMRVGVPASLQQMAMSVNMIFLNALIISIGGEQGVAVFSTGWRVVMMATLPLMGIASALISVAGAAYGARAYRKLRLSLVYAIKFGLKIEVPVAVLMFLLADMIVLAFTWSPGSRDLRGDLVMFIRLFSLMNFFVGFGMLSGATFQAIGKGFNSLIVTIFRTIVFALAFAYIFGSVMGLGLEGVWGGILLGNFLGSLAAFGWAYSHITRLVKGRITPDRAE